jgi:hypothetical protein
VDEDKLWNFIQTNNNKCRISDWEERCKIGADWKKSIQEEKVRIGLYCH